MKLRVDDTTRISPSVNEYKWSPRNGEEYPPSVQRKIGACPNAGANLHDYLPVVANALRHYVTVDRGEEIIFDLAVSRGRSERIARQEARELRKKWDGASTASRFDCPKAARVTANLNEVDRIVCASKISVYDLWAASPAPVDDEPDYIRVRTVHTLFDPEDIIFVSNEPWSGHAGTLEELSEQYDFSQTSYIVPNPLKSREATSGHSLARSLDNIAYRRWVVLEWDLAKYASDGKTPTRWKPYIEKWESLGISVKNAQARLIDHVAKYYKPALIVDSGGKSLHTWFPAIGASDDFLNNFSRYVVSLGADNVIKTASQLFRMPNGTRNNESRTLQQVIYYNDELITSNKLN